jgi:hypothetical protein
VTAARLGKGSGQNKLTVLFVHADEFKLNIECNHATLAGHRYAMLEPRPLH